MQLEIQPQLVIPLVRRNSLLDFLSGDLMHSPNEDQQLVAEVPFTNPSIRSYLTFAIAKMFQTALNFLAGNVVKSSIQSLEQLPRGWCWNRDRVAGLPEFDTVG